MGWDAPSMEKITPGWYPDPHQPGTVRYWDGTQWTAATAPAPVPAPAAPVAVHFHAPAGPRYISGLTAGQQFMHKLVTVLTLGLWWPMWRLHDRMSRRHFG